MDYIYKKEGDVLFREVVLQNGKRISSMLNSKWSIDTIDSSVYEQVWLKTKNKPETSNAERIIRIADLFCGCGGLSLGVQEACRALGFGFNSVFAADISKTALAVYNKNFSPDYFLDSPIEEVIDSEIGEIISDSEKELLSKVGKLDVLIGGPPCQGNSDLNNHTRRNDPRNLLYLRMIRCAEIFRPEFIVIENVPGVQHDTHNVVSIAKSELEKLGYTLDFGTIDMSQIGVAQRRKRFVLIGSLHYKVSLQKAIFENHTVERPLSWAIEDLLNETGDDIYNTPANSSETNKARIDYLFDHNLYDLPNSERPDCHKFKKHSYTSVYGRMHWDIPSPTITGGFGSNGQGRFVHPLRRRTITPHEAARIQFFPDFFDFSGTKRRELQQLIGNAVPAKASFVIGMELLSNLIGGINE